MQPSVRSSTWFRAVQQVLAPTPQEAIVTDAMAYVAGSRLPGDYVEFGVSGGTMFAAAYHAAQRNGLDRMRFYGFDSFEGMPPPSRSDVDFSGDQHVRGAFAADLSEFQTVMSRNRVDQSRIDIVPGWFDDVLTEATKDELQLELAAVVAADCGSYEPTLAALEFVTSYIQDGTLVLFGDWFSYRGSPERGQRRAFAEWLGRNPALDSTPFQRFGWHGHSHIVHRRA
jgi:O-methyltransferase